ncbi:MAG: hypothetical protein H6636_12395 [Anaerolineales bacterium]|nr:hypothetical protein [Anaerolineales bacterium]
MSPRVLNIIGILLEFVSFFFTLPQIVGEKRLEAWEHSFEKILLKSPRDIGLVGLYSLPFVVLWIRLFERAELSAISSGIALVWFMVLLSIVTGEKVNLQPRTRVVTMFILAVPVVILAAIILIDLHPDSPAEVLQLVWLAAAPTLVTTGLVLFVTIVPITIIRLLNKYGDENERLLMFGAGIFAVGLALQLIGAIFIK